MMPILRRLLILFVIVATCISGASCALYYLQPRIPLGNLMNVISYILSTVAGERQSIKGEFYLTPGELTKLEISSAEIKLRGKQGQRVEATIANANANLNILSLLKGSIQFDEFTVEDCLAEIYSNEEDQQRDTSETSIKKNFAFLFSPIQIQQLTLLNAKITIIPYQAGTRKELLIVEAIGYLNTLKESKLEADIVLTGKRLKAKLVSTPLFHPNTQLLNTFSLELSYASSVLDVQGNITNDEDQLQIFGDFSIEGTDFNSISQLFGRPGSKNIDFTLSGAFALDAAGLEVQLKKFMPFASTIELNLKAKKFPVITDQIYLSIKSQVVDINKLVDLISPHYSEESKNHNTNEKEANKEYVILPDKLPLDNVFIDVNISELLLGDNSYRRINLSTNVLNGEIDKAPFHFNFRHHDISGLYSLLYDKDKPELSVSLALPFLDIGLFIKELQLDSEMINSKVHDVAINLETRGTIFGDLLNALKVKIDSKKGTFTYTDKNTDVPLQVAINKMQLSAMPSERIILSFDGAINEIPIDSSFSIDDKRGHNNPFDNIASFEGSIKGADSQLLFAGATKFPVKLKDIEIYSQLKGTKLSDLNELLGVQLPNIGPYSLSGNLSIVDRGYKVDSLDFAIGQTHIMGETFINTKTDPIIFRTNLESSLIQLDDLRGAWLENAPQHNLLKKSAQKSEQSEEDDLPFLTDQEVLDSYDASIRLKIDNVMSGEDHLGSGLFVVNQSAGQFLISPLKINLPHGMIDIEYLLEPSGLNRRYKINININDFNYGILGRHLKPESDIEGIVDLRLQIDSISPNNKEIMQNATGHIDVMIKPERIRSGVIDFWAVNLFNYLVPFIRPNRESRINCLAGRFNLEQGELTQERLLIDTSRIQINGRVNVNYHKDWIEAYLRPIPKRPQFFSLSTPIEIKGSLKKLKIRTTTGGVIGTLIRLATSYFVIPIQWIISNPIPADGTENCRELMDNRVFFQID